MMHESQLRKRPDHPQHPRALVIEPRSRHFGWRCGSTANWGRSRRDRGCAGSRTENVADNAASRRPGPSSRRPASSSATRTVRRLGISISRTSRDAARPPSCSPATRRGASPPTSPSCRSCCARPKRGVYSITLSARTNNASGTVTPIALAVLRLITSSNLVACSTGISAILVPRKS
jgi:hypothetical protein